MLKRIQLSIGGVIDKCKIMTSLKQIWPTHCFNLSNPKHGHTTGGSGRGARRSGWAGLARLATNSTISQGNKGPSHDPKNRKNLSSAKPGNTTGGSGRHGEGRTAGRGDAGLNAVRTFRWPWKPTAPLALQRTVNNCSQRFFAPCNCARTPNCRSDLSSSHLTGSCWLFGLSGGCFPAFRHRREF